MEEIEITTRPGFKEYLKFQLAHVRKYLIFEIIFLVVLSFFMNSKLFLQNDLIVAVIMNIIFSFWIILLVYAVQHLMCLISSIVITKKDKYFKNNVAVHFDSEKITEITENSTVKIAYSEVPRVRVLKSVVAIYTAPSKAILIAVNDSNREKISQIVALLKEKGCKGIK